MEGRPTLTPDCQTLGIPDLNLGSRLSLPEYAPDTIAGAVFSFVTVSFTYEAAGGGWRWVEVGSLGRERELQHWMEMEPHTQQISSNITGSRRSTTEQIASIAAGENDSHAFKHCCRSLHHPGCRPAKLSTIPICNGTRSHPIHMIPSKSLEIILDLVPGISLIDIISTQLDCWL